MRCPLFRATCGRQQGWEAGHGSLPSERPGAGDEGTRSDSAGPEQADYVLGSGTHCAHQSAPPAAAVPALPAIGVWPSLKTDLRNAGAEWVDQKSVVDGNLVSRRKPDDIPAFNRAMIELFGGARGKAQHATL